MFWTRFQEICDARGVKPHAVLKELDISSGSASHWKEGTIPSGEILRKIADYFDLTIEYLLYDDEVAIRPSEKKRTKLFRTLYATPQRWASLHRGDTVEVEQVLQIMNYVNSSLHFINSSSVVEYSPAKEYDETVVLNEGTLFDILDIMDACADSDAFRDLQIQLSRVVLYHLDKKGYSEAVIAATDKLDNEKLHFLYTGKANKDKTKNYGLNYSDLVVLRKMTGLSYQYMFSGIEKTVAEVARENSHS